MKFKRSDRLIDMTSIMLENPHHLFPLDFFVKRYLSAKSSISEDIAILRDLLEVQDIGTIETLHGNHGGVIYKPCISVEKQWRYMQDVIDVLNNHERILPGGYLYITDVISNPQVMRKVGKVIASYHADDDLDYIFTVETKGIMVAQAVAYELNIPIVIARKDSKITEGSKISINYTSQSAPHIVQRMEVGRNSMERGSKILIVDDFLRGEGTMKGMMALAEIFELEVLGRYVMCENLEEGSNPVDYYKSLISIRGLELDEPELSVTHGSLFKN